jgi:hypothetical protein
MDLTLAPLVQASWANYHGCTQRCDAENRQLWQMNDAGPERVHAHYSTAISVVLFVDHDYATQFRKRSPGCALVV